MITYYAVANANGPITRALSAATLDEARAELQEADLRSWIDEPATDLEDALDECWDGQSESEVESAMRQHDMVCVDAGKGIVGDWTIWSIDA